MTKKSMLKFLTIGGIAGLVLGFLVNILSGHTPQFMLYPSMPVSFLLNKIHKCYNISCAFNLFYSILVAYTVMGLLIGYFIYKLKKKK